VVKNERRSGEGERKKLRRDPVSCMPLVDNHGPVPIQFSALLPTNRIMSIFLMGVMKE